MEDRVWEIVSTVVILLVIVILFLQRSKKSSLEVNWPEGPRKLPIIGNLHQINKASDVFYIALAKLANRYGNVMTVWLGGWLPFIVISDGELAWEVLVNKSSDYAARGLADIDKIISANWRTIHASDTGSHWYSLRKGLQNGALGPHNVSMQTHFHEKDMNRMIDSLKEEASNNGGLVKPFIHLKRASVRLLSRLCFGTEFEDDKFAESMEREVEELIRISSHGRISDIFPFARYIPFLNDSFQKTYEVKRRVEELIRPYLSINPSPNTYLHFLLSQNYPEEIIIFAIYEMFLLGVDSTASTATWALAYLIRDQNTQKKLYQDIVKKSNKEKKIVTIDELNKMEYVQVVAKETMRMKPIAPLAIPHKATKDTTLMGRDVPAGTRVLVNIYAIHYNPKVWTEPQRFMPERFINSSDSSNNGKTNLSFNFIPFGGGMRACAGMELGKLQLAYALANLVKAFEWSCISDGQLPDMTEEPSFVLVMKTPLVARIVPRHV